MRMTVASGGVGMGYFAVILELLYFIVAAVAERCYDCDSRNHKHCAEFELFSASPLVKNCAKSPLDPEQDRCIKMHSRGTNVIMRSCVKESSPAASMDDGRCTVEGDVITCVCSGYLCNAAASINRRPFSLTSPSSSSHYWVTYFLPICSLVYMATVLRPQPIFATV